jgi:hypothetical protein
MEGKEGVRRGKVAAPFSGAMCASPDEQPCVHFYHRILNPMIYRICNARVSICGKERGIAHRLVPAAGGEHGPVGGPRHAPHAVRVAL